MFLTKGSVCKINKKYSIRDPFCFFKTSMKLDMDNNF